MNGKDIPYFKHIMDAIRDIENSTKNLSREDFENNKDVKDAVIRRIEIIGEAVKNISKETRNKYHEIEWKKIVGTRDIIIHAYFNVDLDIAWDIVKKDLPKLKKEIGRILKNNK